MYVCVYTWGSEMYWGWAFLSGNLYWVAGAGVCGAGVGILTWMLVGSRLTSALNPYYCNTSSATKKNKKKSLIFIVQYYLAVNERINYKIM